MDSSKNVNQWKEEGNQYFTQQNYKEAARCYTEGLIVDPNNSVILSNRSECFLKVGAFNRALIDASRSLDIDPANLKSRIRLCKSVIYLKRLNEAEVFLEDLHQHIALLDKTKELLPVLNELDSLLNEARLRGLVDSSRLTNVDEDDTVKQGHKHMKLLSYTDALWAYTKAIRTTPEAETHLHILHHAHLALIDTMHVRNAFGKIHVTLEAKACKLQAQALCMLGAFSNFTIRILNTAIRLNPSDPSLPNLLTMVTSKLPNPVNISSMAMEFTVPFEKRFTDEEEALYLKTVFSDNPLLEIRTIPNMGRGVFAKQNIKKGQILCKVKPVLAATLRDDVCQNCFVELPNIDTAISCSGCGEEFYCSQECKQESWDKYHKEMCYKGIQALRKYVLDKAVSSSGKMILLAARHMGMVKSSKHWQSIKNKPDYCGEPDLPELKFLVASHKDFTLQLDPFFNFNQLAKIYGLTNDPYFNMEWYINVICKIVHNSFTCDDDHNKYPKTWGSGIVVYEGISFFNHSCVPNVKIAELIPEGVILATTAITKGDQCFLSYCSYPTVHETRLMLLGVYGFELQASDEWKVDRSSTTIYYYEIFVKEIENAVGIGLALGGFSTTTKMPGWVAGSYAYHGDDGQRFNGGSATAGWPLYPIHFTIHYSQTHYCISAQFRIHFGKNVFDNMRFGKDQSVGLGLKASTGEIFGTLNGKYLGLITATKENAALYPTIGFDSPGEVEVRFDTKDFVFDVSTLPETLSPAFGQLETTDRISNKVIVLYLDGVEEAERERLKGQLEVAAQTAKPKHDFQSFYTTETDKMARGIREFSGVYDSSPLVLAVNLETDEKYAIKEVGAITTENILKFVDDIAAGKLTSLRKSAPRPLNDKLAEHPSITEVVALSFDELVLQGSKDVLLDVFADWCGPCRAIAPTIVTLSEIFADNDNIVIAKLDCDKNDIDRTYLPETSIPNIKLFRGANKKEPIKYKGNRSLDDFVDFLYTNATVPFDLEAVKAKGKKVLEEAEKKLIKNVKHVHTTEEFGQHLKSDKLVIVDYFATWCGPCKAIAPIYANLSEEFSNALFLKVDVDKLKEVAKEQQVKCMPTFKAYKNGTAVGSLEGADVNALKKLVTDNL